MLDHYILGKVERISPEAPVPVVAVAGYDDRAGGAANVALNIKACAAETAIFSVVGDDNTAKKLRAVLTKAKVDHKGMIASKERMTTLKARVIGNNHQLLRYDQEDTHELSCKEEQALFKAFSAACNSKKPNAVVLEDYDKGVLTPALIKQVIAYCNKNKIPTFENSL
jgi:rfaE bifunctional protein kinase chain/domain